jgi:hypothetical protein
MSTDVMWMFAESGKISLFIMYVSIIISLSGERILAMVKIRQSWAAVEEKNPQPVPLYVRK